MTKKYNIIFVNFLHHLSKGSENTQIKLSREDTGCAIRRRHYHRDKFRQDRYKCRARCKLKWDAELKNKSKEDFPARRRRREIGKSAARVEVLRLRCQRRHDIKKKKKIVYLWFKQITQFPVLRVLEFWTVNEKWAQNHVCSMGANFFFLIYIRDINLHII